MKLYWPDDLPLSRFMDEFWQKKPVFIEGAFPQLTELITADELAGLACEDEIESRIVIEQGADNKWLVEHGPFAEERFSELPESHWTLLVQDVDKHIPDARELVAQFNFLPKWRIDDLMVSYAADQGSVGPHTDSYDVFLIQLQGERLWKLSDKQYSDTDLIDNCDIRVLKDYRTSEQFLLKPGDMLYLPPQIGHWGIAQGECMTGSVGFISPKQNELFNSWADHISEGLTDNSRYQDPEIFATDNPGLITHEAISKISHLLGQAIYTNPDYITRWFGEMISEAKPHLILDVPPDLEFNTDKFKKNHQELAFCRHPYLRIFYSLTDEGLILFANGESFDLSIETEPFVRFICEHDDYPENCFAQWLDNDECMACLVMLINRGYIVQHEKD